MGHFTITMGYGMPWHRFEELVLFDCEAHETENVLEQVFVESPPEVFTVADEEYSQVHYAQKRHKSAYLSKEILFERAPRNYGDIATIKKGRSSELFKIIRTIDGYDREPEHVIFYPSVEFARSWTRNNDVIDFYLYDHFFSKVKGDVVKMPRKIEYKSHGFGFWAADYQAEGGQLIRRKADFPFSDDAVEADSYTPAVPSEIRWYLTKLGVLDDEGARALRPIMASYYW